MAPCRPLLCVAPAGSGKTTTLVARICWLIDEGAEPATIAAITFNRRAAQELGSRLDAALEPLGLAAGSVRVRTFHALGLEILRDAGEQVDLVDRADVLRSLLGDRLTPHVLRRLDDAFSRLKLDLSVDAAQVNAEVDADEQAGHAVGPIVHAFLAYEAALRERGAIDFDDLVRLSLARLRADAPLRARWRAACAHLLVDEVQDLDRSQLNLALLLAEPANDIFLVGDDDQTIYAWRLADVRRVIGLAAVLPGLLRVDLVTNYRCPPPVVARAVRLVEHNRERFVKVVRAGSREGGALILAPDAGDDVARARRLLRSWVVPGGEVRAILARTNAELAPYAAAAIELGVPYRVADDLLLLDEPEIDALLTEVAGSSIPLMVALARVAAHSAGERLRAAAALLAWAPGHRNAASLKAAVDEARRRRVELRRDDALLVLATAHGTKGLEFDHVCCIGLDEGRFPSARSIAESDEPERVMEEERRLAYVAWTRAKRTLILLFDPYAPSPFMREAFDPQELSV